jgi:hypothetical protein
MGGKPGEPGAGLKPKPHERGAANLEFVSAGLSTYSLHATRSRQSRTTRAWVRSKISSSGT